MPGMFDGIASRWCLELLEPGEGRIISLDDFRASGMESRKFAQLVQSDGCLQIRHVVFESRVSHFVVPRISGAVPFPSITIHSMKTPNSCFLDGFRGAG